MTVNDYKETACVTAGVNEDVEIESDHILQTNNASHSQQQQDSEHLLGRVLAEIKFIEPPCIRLYRSSHLMVPFKLNENPIYKSEAKINFVTE
ncbi:hypothetical protein QE152_g15852 [Popillia japonica]|uniref:Uncharacterized protein n=1 Tax=Popillia japonica TaxID=7064 RepID=A0AAW1L4E0_POPJA